MELYNVHTVTANRKGNDIDLQCINIIKKKICATIVTTT